MGPPQTEASKTSALLREHHAVDAISQRREARFTKFTAVAPRVCATHNQSPFKCAASASNMPRLASLAASFARSKLMLTANYRLCEKRPASPTFA